MTFRRAATRYLEENQHKVSIAKDARALELVDPFIGALEVKIVHAGTVAPFIESRRKQGIKSATVRRELAIVRRVLTLSARLWRHEDGMPWLDTVPLLPAVDWNDARKPNPLTVEEEQTLIESLPPHLARCALFMVNTGLRDSELRALRWEWLQLIPQMNRRLFVLPGDVTKNRRERVVPLNDIAWSVIKDEEKGVGHVFTYQGEPMATALNNTAWQKTRDRIRLDVRIHDLRHTFGRRLRSVGVSHETRADLLGHDRGSVTTHYSMAELRELFNAVDRLTGKLKSVPVLRAIS